MDKWGPNIWCYIHTYTTKIKENLNNNEMKIVMEHLYSVSTNLPCPICSEHARKYLSSKYKYVHSKSELVKLFIDFHNDVNKRKSKPIKENNIIDIYKSKQLIECANNYVYTWQKASTSKYLGSTSNFANKLYIKRFKEYYWKYVHLLEK